MGPFDQFLKKVVEDCVNADGESPLTPEQWRKQEERISIENAEADEREHRFKEDYPQ